MPNLMATNERLADLDIRIQVYFVRVATAILIFSLSGCTMLPTKVLQPVIAPPSSSYEILGDRKRAVKCLEEALQNGLSSEPINGDLDLERISADPNLRTPK